ncbi:MAG: regulatory signaling modulator protein AmpE [Pseudomonadota bacterium]
MTLFVLLIVMAFERISTKSKQWHIATWCDKYFTFLREKGRLSSASLAKMYVAFIIAAVPSVAAFIIVKSVPLIFVFALNLVLLWVCLGCPVTRSTYKKYLQSASREDFVACALHSEDFGNHGGNLDNVGKQLVLVNYRQYAAVIIFFVFTGIYGLLFYSIVKELSLHMKRAEKRVEDETDVDKLLFFLDWIPVRLTTFGFMIVGHFSHALGAWVPLITNVNKNTYDALGEVAKAAEEVENLDSVVDEPLQLVKLVKRNVVFLLMLTAVGTMVGILS